MEYMYKNGVPRGENGISRTYTDHKTYYLCESPRNMRLHREYEKVIGITK